MMNYLAIKQYDSPHIFESLFPQDRIIGVLLIKASERIKKLDDLGASAAPDEVLPFLALWAEDYGQSRCGEASAVAT